MDQSFLEELKIRLRQFAVERDWDQFHSPKHLSMGLIAEAAEVVEHFQWLTEEQSNQLPPEEIREVELELADVLIYTRRHKPDPSRQAASLAAVPAHSAIRLRRGLLALSLPDRAPRTYVAVYSTKKGSNTSTCVKRPTSFERMLTRRSSGPLDGKSFDPGRHHES